jgi:hypothetical protein
MIKRLGIIFSGLLIVLLLSNINTNANIQVLAQQNTSASTTNSSVPTVSDTVSNTTKLSGGVKIISPDKGDLVPLNSNNSLVIKGVSKDNVTSDCDVSIIVNNVKPYQNVKPTGVQGDNDYSNWQYTVASNYTNINEGNNKITSKILCLDGPQKLQAFYSVNITATNFTQAQLSSYNTMLESSNSTTNSGNMSQTSSLLQPYTQIQQFNQDTGNGPICCKTTASSSPGSGIGGSTSSTSSNDNNDDSSSGSGSSSTSSNDNNDDSSSGSGSRSTSSNDNNDDSSSGSGSRSTSSNDDNDDSSSGSRSTSSNDDNDDSSSGSRSTSSNDDNDDSSSGSRSTSSNDDNDDSDFGFNFDNNNNDDNDDSDSGVGGILSDVEDTMRSVGIDFSFS